MVKLTRPAVWGLDKNTFLIYSRVCALSHIPTILMRHRICILRFIQHAWVTCKYVILRHNEQHRTILRTDLFGHKQLQRLEQVHDFQYFGAWVNNTEADIEIRKALARKPCNKLTKIRKPTLSRSIKISLFISTVESILLYGCEAWTLTK